MQKKSGQLFEEKNTNFAGNLLINTRTITQTNDLFEKIVHTRTNQNKITVSELSELLVLLESISTSNELVYDATVPSGVIDNIRASEINLERQIDNKNIFRGVKPNSEKQTLALCKAGIKQSSALLAERIGIFKNSREIVSKRLKDVKPLNVKSATAFAKELTNPLPPMNEREEYANQLIRRNPFNGAKCAAGILSTEAEEDHLAGSGDDIRSLCRDLVRDQTEDDLCYIVPMMMNAFRSNFLNTLGAEHGEAAFFAGPDIEQVMDQQVFLLSSYVAGKLTDSGLAPELLESALGERFQNTNQFPFLGLLTLLGGEDGDPYSIFRNSLSDKDHLLAEFLAKKSGKKRYIHDFNAEELNEFKEEKLGNIFQKLQKRVKVFNWVDRVNHKLLQPALEWYPLLKPYAEIALNKLNINLNLEDIPDGMGDPITYIINQTLMPDKYLNYATFTHNINKKLHLALSNRGEQDIITERVSKVLGCELVKG